MSDKYDGFTFEFSVENISKALLPPIGASPLEFIASITQHIPEMSFQLVRYYGWYSNRMRGDRKKQEERGKGKGNQRAPPMVNKDYTEQVEIVPCDDGWPGNEETVVEF